MADAVKDAVKDLSAGVKQLAVGDDKKQQKPQKQQQPKKDKKAKGKDGGASGPDELSSPPEYIDHRIKMFEELKAQYDAEVAKKPRHEITITLKDGKIEVGTAWETTPAAVAKGISKSLLERVVISKVDGELWDLERPFEKSCSLELLTFDDPDGRYVFWHSSAHILGEACERRFGCDLCIGPPVDVREPFHTDLPHGLTAK
jgi:threonyl-tRNA synthetase